jgi:hypothetical protein
MTRPPRPGLPVAFQLSASRGCFHTAYALRTVRTANSSSSVRGVPRSSSVKLRCGSAAQSRAASAHPAVPPPMMT